MQLISPFAILVLSRRTPVPQSSSAMAIKNKLSFIISLMLALGGTLFGIIAWNSYTETYSILQNGTQTFGVVIDNVPKPRRGNESPTTSLAPVVRFLTGDGKETVWYSQTYTTPARFQIGEAVQIWYLPENPQRATLQDVDAWVLPIVFGIFGTVMCLIGYPGLVRSFFA